MQTSKNNENVSKILKERGNEYGDFYTNCAFAIKFFKQNFTLDSTLDSILDSKSQEAHMFYNLTYYYVFMIAAKLARLHYNPTHEDSIIDLQGYTRLYKENLAWLKIDYTLSFTPLTFLESKLNTPHANFVEMINSMLKEE